VKINYVACMLNEMAVSASAGVNLSEMRKACRVSASLRSCASLIKLLLH
jgi:hypothetical protein